MFGLCREDFQVNKDMNQQDNVWAINLKTGDKYSKREWYDYYDVGQESGQDPEFGNFKTGTIVGALVDVANGIISFYKDGQSMGIAF